MRLDPLLDRDCVILDGSCKCRSINDCTYGTKVYLDKKSADPVILGVDQGPRKDT